jgi:hypothetical protein
MANRSLRVVGDDWSHQSLPESGVNSLILKLRSQGCIVQQFQSGYDCEIDGLQIFAATRMERGDNYHVRLNSKVFPDV